MRFLIVDTIYGGFLQWLYNERHPGLAGKSFAEQYDAQVQGFFHTAGAWSEPLRRLGHQVLDVSANNAPQQLRWMAENDLMGVAKTYSDGLTFGGYTLRQKQEVNWQVAFVAEQVKLFRPDVLLCANLYLFDDSFLAMVEGHYGKAVGQHAAVMPRNSLSRYDLIISSLPNQVQAFREAGIRAELLGLAFDERLLPHLEDRGRRHEVAFIGSVSGDHRGRAAFLAETARHHALDFWGNAQWPQGTDLSGTTIRPNPPLYGLPMYQVMRDCRMVLNYHLDAAGAYANNLRLFEATGVGSVLVTDNKRNIRDYFEPGAECVVYDDAADCIRQLTHLKAHPDEAEAIARAGQRRTLGSHSYHHRVGPLLQMVG
jgi:hypothetical protein